METRESSRNLRLIPATRVPTLLHEEYRKREGSIDQTEHWRARSKFKEVPCTRLPTRDPRTQGGTVPRVPPKRGATVVKTRGRLDQPDSWDHNGLCLSSGLSLSGQWLVRTGPCSGVVCTREDGLGHCVTPVKSPIVFLYLTEQTLTCTQEPETSVGPFPDYFRELTYVGVKEEGIWTLFLYME